MIQIAKPEQSSLSHPATVPSLQDIRERAAAIRDEWSAEERARRQRMSQQLWQAMLAVQATIS